MEFRSSIRYLGTYCINYCDENDVEMAYNFCINGWWREDGKKGKRKKKKEMKERKKKKRKKKIKNEKKYIWKIIRM